MLGVDRVFSSSAGTTLTHHIGTYVGSSLALEASQRVFYVLDNAFPNYIGSMAGQNIRTPNPKNSSPNSKNPSPKNLNANSGFDPRYLKLLWVIRISNHNTRTT